MTLDRFPNHDIRDLNVQFCQVRGSPSSGTPEISWQDCMTVAQPPTETALPEDVDSTTHERFNLAVAACREAISGGNFFRERKGGLVNMLDPAYSIYRLVKSCPDLEGQLYKLDLFEARTRRLSKNKLALATVYCALQPQNADDFKACSDYTAYLLEAEEQKTSVDDFVEWAKPLTLKSCLKAVRQRKRDRSMGDQDRPLRLSADLRLSITRNAKGVRGSMDGHTFPLTPATLDAIVELIKADAAPRALGTGDEAGSGSA